MTLINHNTFKPINRLKLSNKQYNKINNNPETTSQHILCLGIVEKQNKHFPLKNKKEKTGTSSYHESSCLQTVQCDFGSTID